MLARCYRCRNTFSTEVFGVQKCPSCGSEIFLPVPAATPAAQEKPSSPGGQEEGPQAPQPPQEAPTPEGAAEPGAAGSGSPPAMPPPGAGGPGWGRPPPGWTPTAGGRWAAGPFVEQPVEEQSSPFAERAQHGFFSSLWQTWRLAALEPARFFRRVRVDEMASALLFGVICMTLGHWGFVAFNFATASSMKEFLVQFSPRMGEAFPIFQAVQGLTLKSFLVQLVVSPALALAGIYVMAGVFHLFLLMVRAAPRRFDATLTTVAYAAGVLVLRALPACGGLLATVWFTVVVIQGLAEAQRCGPGKAAFAVFMPLVAVCLVACAAGMIAAVMVGAGSGNGTPTSTGL